MTLIEAIEARHSVRRYLDRAIPAQVVEALRQRMEECNRDGRLNMQLVLNESRAFTGWLSYGKFSGVKNYLAMIGETGDGLDERVGYYGEQMVLYAQTLGLNSCWVGLSYRKVKDVYAVGVGEKLACMIALGYGVSSGSRHKIKTVSQVSNAGTATPAWFERGVRAALLAPTAVNQQKFRFEYLGMQRGRALVKAVRGFSLIGYTEMDLGIAKCHVELAAGRENFEWA